MEEIVAVEGMRDLNFLYAYSYERFGGGGGGGSGWKNWGFLF